MPKKTDIVRQACISRLTYEAVKDFMTSSKASEEKVMFPPGCNQNPTNKWVKKVRYFFKSKAGIKVLTHNFRVTLATDLYKSSGHNLKTVQNILGHSKIETTAGYVKQDRKEAIAAVITLQNKKRKGIKTRKSKK